MLQNRIWNRILNLCLRQGSWKTIREPAQAITNLLLRRKMARFESVKVGEKREVHKMCPSLFWRTEQDSEPMLAPRGAENDQGTGASHSQFAPASQNGEVRISRSEQKISRSSLAGRPAYFWRTEQDSEPMLAPKGRGKRSGNRRKP